ncbi:MAG: tyrosine-type recombinase/integrase [Candidatus Obscuribacter sp.]|nr:tyrosine-type recombinase/integrase [Candidatus Obscuribacter sp.]MBP6350029.1 tyrosine-type recombinase/integrase [Candidatus Obscuribacter sp.]
MNYKVRITKQLIANLDKYKPTSGKGFIRDTSIVGFAVCITKTSATYTVEGQVKGTRKNRRRSIGKVVLIDLDEARRQAKAFMLDLASGLDPTSNKNNAADQVPTLREALALYLQQRPLTRNTRKQYETNLNSNLSSMMDRPISAITEGDVIKEFQRIKSRAPVVANLVMSMLHSVLGFASAHPDYRFRDGSRMLVISPVRILSELKMKSKPAPRTDHLTVDELPRFAKALDRLQNRTARNLILFLVLTGWRFNEARELRWSEVSMLRFRIDLPAERCKTKAKRVLPITAEIMAVLEEQGTLKTPVSTHVFISKTSTTAITEDVFREAFKQVRNEIGRSDLKIHGLRRTYVSHTSRREVLTEHEQKILVGHALDQTGRYRQTSFEDLKAAAQRATAHITKLMTTNKVDTETICSG